MNDALRVTVGHTLQDLLQVALDKVLWQSVAVTETVQVLCQVSVAVLLNEVDIIVAHHRVLQGYDIGVFELHQDCDFSDRRRRDPIVAIVDMRPLYCILFLGLTVDASVNRAISALA